MKGAESESECMQYSVQGKLLPFYLGQLTREDTSGEGRAGQAGPAPRICSAPIGWLARLFMLDLTPTAARPPIGS